MSLLTDNRGTKRLGNAEEYMGLFDVKAAEVLFAGGMLAINKSTLEIETAKDAANLLVVGVCALYIDNTLDGKTSNAKKGIYLFKNSAGDPLTRADIGQICFVEDDQTVNKSGGTYLVEAGKVYDVVDAGVWIDMRDISLTTLLRELKLNDGANIELGITTGSKIGTAATQKLAFFGATPVVQQAHIDDPDAMDDVTASAPAELTYSDPAAITATNPSWGDTTSVDQSTNLSTFGAAVVTDLTAIRNALVAAGVDLGAIRTPVSALVADIGNAKTAVDSNNTAIDSGLARLETFGFSATE